MTVQTKLDELKVSFGKQDYPAVVAAAPAVLDAAQSLATAAAAKKDEVLKALDDRWTALAGSVPGYMTAIQNRIDDLSKKSNKKAAAGIDIEAARSGLSDAASLWSKAQAAFAGGNMEEAVNTAERREGKGRGGGGELEAGAFRSRRQIMSGDVGSQRQGALADNGCGAGNVRGNHAAFVDFKPHSDLAGALHLVALSADEVVDFLPNWPKSQR